MRLFWPNMLSQIDPPPSFLPPGTRANSAASPVIPHIREEESGVFFLLRFGSKVISDGHGHGHGHGPGYGVHGLGPLALVGNPATDSQQ